MLRTILGIAAGFVAWWIIVTAINRGVLHLAWPAYAAADTPAMAFSLSMKIARLAESSVASILAALIAWAAAPSSRYAVPAYGVVLLIMFLPIHYMIWDKFPIWYHLYFLSSLVVLPVLTLWIVRRAAGSAAVAAV